MSKKFLAFFFILALTQVAQASRARLQALGEGVDGSYFIQDPRNIFYNPARALYHKDGVAMEWGNTANADDAAATPRAEGGVLKSHGNLVYGAYFGNQADDGNGYKSYSGTGIQEMNSVSGLVAGDAGMQWGFAFTYGEYENKNSSFNDGGSGDQNEQGEAQFLRTRFGMMLGDVEFFTRVNLINEAKSNFTTVGNATQTALASGRTSAEFEGTFGMQLGVIKNIGTMTYALVASKLSGEDKQRPSAKEHDYLTVEFQAGKVTQLNDKATMNWRVGVKRQTEEGLYLVTGADQGLTTTEIATTAFSANAKEVKILKVPVNIGLEVMAKDWLVLRGSVSQNIWSSAKVNGNDFTLENTTIVNAGAGLLFGDLIIDGMIGNSTGTATGESTATSNGSLRTDALLTRVGMTYKF